MSDAPTVIPPERTADSLWRDAVAKWFDLQFRSSLVSVQIPETELPYARRLMEAMHKINPLSIILAALGDPEPIEVAEVRCERAVAAHLTKLLHSLGGNHLSVARLRLDKPFTPLHLWWGQREGESPAGKKCWYSRFDCPADERFSLIDASEGQGVHIAATYLNLPQDDALVATAAKPLTAWLEQQDGAWVLTGDDVGKLLEKVD